MQDMRRGTFSISADLIDNRPEIARLVLRNVIVVRAEMMWHSNRVEYSGLHPDFDEIDVCEMPREYVAVITERRGNDRDQVEFIDYSVTWQRRERAAISNAKLGEFTV